MNPNAGGQWLATAFPLPVRVIREGTLRLPHGGGAAKEIRLGRARCQLARAEATLQSRQISAQSTVGDLRRPQASGPRQTRLSRTLLRDDVGATWRGDPKSGPHGVEEFSRNRSNPGSLVPQQTGEWLCPSCTTRSRSMPSTKPCSLRISANVSSSSTELSLTVPTSR